MFSAMTRRETKFAAIDPPRPLALFQRPSDFYDAIFSKANARLCKRKIGVILIHLLQGITGMIGYCLVKICSFHLRFTFVGSLLWNTRQRKKATFGGVFKFHKDLKISTSCPPTHILYIALYDDWTMNFDDGSSNHRHEFFPYMTIVTLWIMLCRCSTNILSHLNSCRIHLSSHRHNPCTKQLMFWIDSLFCSEIVNSLAKRFWRHSFPTHLSSQNLECFPFPTFHSIPLSNQPLLSPPHSQIPPPY